ncbi:MAG: DNA mismatch repair endonuclease MutL [Succinatimonas sp.]|nr:DNA mismatch repair endonuclease MutL [Succinatimonas sp.]
MTIRRLSVQLANQIAAGEVVERPCSVVKELLENSVDAGATEIKCFVEGAGRILIRVSDNGSGIPCDELVLALAPHATSKISCTEDLDNILTLGFRGEALASIASVTRLTLTSRTADEADGYSVTCEGPEMEASVIPCPHGVGTTVEARELFFNTPARRRFLRSDRTELNRIRDVFVRCALAHPKIGFELISDKKTLLKVKAAADEGQKLKRMSYLAGGEFSKEGAAVKCEDPLLSIEGVALSAGDATQGGAEKIFLFLNSRPIADRSVTHAVREAYSQFFGSQAAARCVLYLACDPHEADVNVHPRKDEVRFHSMKAVHDLIVEALLRAFDRFMPAKDDLLGDLESKTVVPEYEGLPQDLEAIVAGKTVNSKEEQPSLPDFPDGDGFFVSPLSKSESPNVTDDTALRLRSFTDMTRSHAKASMMKISVSKPQATTYENLQDEDISFKPRETNDAEQEVQSPADDHEKKQSGAVLVDTLTENTVLVKFKGSYLAVCIPKLFKKQQACAYAQAVCQDRVLKKDLSLPFSLKCAPELAKALKNCNDNVRRCGFDITFSRQQITVSSVPCGLENTELSSFLIRCLSVIASSDELSKGRCPKTLSACVAEALPFEEKSLQEIRCLLDDSSEEMLRSAEVSIDLKVREAALELERGFKL